MRELIQFVVNLAHYYPPESVSLYLLIGLGMVYAKLTHSNATPKNVLQLFGAIFIAIPVGIVLGVINIALWPAYLTGSLYNSLYRN